MPAEGSPRDLVRGAYQPRFDFNAEPSAPIEPQDALVLDLGSYEGPLHVLLELAKGQKVDLLKISITRLADQYLAFVAKARGARFALAADYLVMAAWLAYLKSRLLLPKPEQKTDEAGTPEDLAEQLAFRLAKLDAMRRAAEALYQRPKLRQEVFPRGDPEQMTILSTSRTEASLYELMEAYVSQRLKAQKTPYDPKMRVEAYSLEAARDHLREQLPRLSTWTALETLVPRPAFSAFVTTNGDPLEGPSPASFLASTFCAGLELVKARALDLYQDEPFGPLYLKRAQPGGPDHGERH